jgi:hypothetical protein
MHTSLLIPLNGIHPIGKISDILQGKKIYKDRAKVQFPVRYSEKSWRKIKINMQ